MKRKSFFEKITGGGWTEEDALQDEEESSKGKTFKPLMVGGDDDKFIAEEEDAQLTVDVGETEDAIIVKTMVAGVHPDELDVDITRDTITIHGKREFDKSIDEGDYFVRELYWGSFSRSISLPAEVEPENAEATEKHGLLVIKIPKIDKKKRAKVKVKSL